MRTAAAEAAELRATAEAAVVLRPVAARREAVLCATLAACGEEAARAEAQGAAWRSAAEERRAALDEVRGDLVSLE
eukprot:3377376-Prymnesium_polylepis.1